MQQLMVGPRNLFCVGVGGRKSLENEKMGQGYEGSKGSRELEVLRTLHLSWSYLFLLCLPQKKRQLLGEKKNSKSCRNSVTGVSSLKLICPCLPEGLKSNNKSEPKIAKQGWEFACSVIPWLRGVEMIEFQEGDESSLRFSICLNLYPSLSKDWGS